MADTKALPVFAFCDDKQQLAELRTYFNAKGAKLDKTGPADVTENLTDLMSAVGILSGCPNDKEVDMILSSICSLIVCVPEKKSAGVVAAFCAQLKPTTFKGVGWSSNAGAAMRTLLNLFRGFARHSATHQLIFETMTALAVDSRLVSSLETDVETLQRQFAGWKTGVEKQRDLLRQLHQGLLNDQRADQAAKVMIALLGLYTDADAAKAIEDARECVRTAVVDPRSFSFDHLLRLSAVKALQKSDAVMYEALELFTTGTLSDYEKFTKKHPKFVAEQLNVNETVLVKKIRLLTLMSRAEKNNIIPLAELSKELNISDSEELEEFIIDAIQVNAISGKVSETSGMLVVSSFQHRTFGREQWLSLQSRLRGLISNLRASHANIANINQQTEIAA